MTLVMTVVMKVILLDGVGGRREAHRIIFGFPDDTCAGVAH